MYKLVYNESFLSLYSFYGILLFTQERLLTKLLAMTFVIASAGICLQLYRLTTLLTKSKQLSFVLVITTVSLYFLQCLITYINTGSILGTFKFLIYFMIKYVLILSGKTQK